jgi:DNA-binding CsgD family transcriptional regulator
MSRVNPYASIAKRTFQAALIHLLETEYRVLGSQRVLRVLAEDVERLAEEFYLTPDRARSGQLVWACTGDEGQKAQPGKPTEAYKTVTVLLPLIEPSELKERTERCGKGQGLARAHERQKRQVQRIVTAAAEQGGLLTLAEVSLILGIGYEAARGYVQNIEHDTGKPLPLKGYKMDQGSRPSHKGEVIRWFEQGLEPPDIARETKHNLKSVERYLKDYERVRMLLKQGLSVEAISAIIGRGKSVVKEYVAQAQVYHPELFKKRGKRS